MLRATFRVVMMGRRGSGWGKRGKKNSRTRREWSGKSQLLSLDWILLFLLRRLVLIKESSISIKIDFPSPFRLIISLFTRLQRCTYLQSLIRCRSFISCAYMLRFITNSELFPLLFEVFKNHRQWSSRICRMKLWIFADPRCHSANEWRMRRTTGNEFESHFKKSMERNERMCRVEVGE